MHLLDLDDKNLVTHAEARAIRKHARCNVHGEQFLEQKFGRIRDMDLRDASFVLAGTAFVLALFELAVFQALV